MVLFCPVAGAPHPDRSKTVRGVFSPQGKYSIAYLNVEFNSFDL